MTSYELLLSESQERMLIVAHAGREREVVDIFRKWELDAVVIGHVREGSNMRIVHNGEVVGDIPVAALTDEAPEYNRPMQAPARYYNTDGHGATQSELAINNSKDDEALSVGAGIDHVQPAPRPAPVVVANQSGPD